MKQRRHLKSRISATTAATILSIALAGATCGTFAWFTYDTRAKIIDNLEGVTIGLGELDAGILSNVDLPDADLYGLIKDDSNPNETIYWFRGRKIEPDALSYVLAANGYAYETLIPVTTRKYANGDDFNLFSTPRMLNDSDEKAKKEGQVFLPLVFRYHDVLEEDETAYIADQKIALSKVKLNILDENSHIHEAIRIHTDDKNGLSHLINPSSIDDGATNVGGLLDLDGDGFYDIEIHDEKLYEHVYGQVIDWDYKNSPETVDTLPESTSEYKNSFVAGHKSGVYALNTCTPEVAEFEGLNDFTNKRKWVTTTNSQTNNYAYLDLSIFIEGWDSNVINREIGIPFSVEVTFEAIL